MRYLLWTSALLIGCAADEPVRPSSAVYDVTCSEWTVTSTQISANCGGLVVIDRDLGDVYRFRDGAPAFVAHSSDGQVATMSSSEIKVFDRSLEFVTEVAVSSNPSALAWNGGRIEWVDDQRIYSMTPMKREPSNVHTRSWHGGKKHDLGSLLRGGRWIQLTYDGYGTSWLEYLVWQHTGFSWHRASVRSTEATVELWSRLVNGQWKFGSLFGSNPGSNMLHTRTLEEDDIKELRLLDDWYCQGQQIDEPTGATNALLCRDYATDSYLLFRLGKSLLRRNIGEDRVLLRTSVGAAHIFSVSERAAVLADVGGGYVILDPESRELVRLSADLEVIGRQRTLAAKPRFGL